MRPKIYEILPDLAFVRALLHAEDVTVREAAGAKYGELITAGVHMSDLAKLLARLTDQDAQLRRDAVAELQVVLVSMEIRLKPETYQAIVDAMAERLDISVEPDEVVRANCVFGIDCGSNSRADLMPFESALKYLAEHDPSLIVIKAAHNVLESPILEIIDRLNRSDLNPSGRDILLNLRRAAAADLQKLLSGPLDSGTTTLIVNAMADRLKTKTDDPTSLVEADEQVRNICINGIRASFNRPVDLSFVMPLLRDVAAKDPCLQVRETAQRTLDLPAAREVPNLPPRPIYPAPARRMARPAAIALGGN
ncbi:hypothetical protein HY988_02885 [Candidatus Micrarchaeota archaeon]|nr:hypothetical protein [Candidatus Micrarchaeota archaeon]